MKRFVVLAALALCGVGGFASQVAHAQEAKTWTEIHIGTEGAFRPWNYTNPDGSLGGFEIDLYQDLCRRMQVKCTIAAQSFDSLIPALAAGNSTPSSRECRGRRSASRSSRSPCRMGRRARPSRR